MALLIRPKVQKLTFYIKPALHIHAENVHPEVCSRSDKIHCRWVVLPITNNKALSRQSHFTGITSQTATFTGV